MLLFVLAPAGLGYGRPALAQTAQPAASPAVADVRQIVTDARKEIESYRTPTLFVLDRGGRIFAKPGSAKQIELSLQEALSRPAQP